MDGPAQFGRSASPVTEWALDPTVTFLNHGSFGACPRAILEVQRGWRDKIEMNPVRFLARDLEDLLDWSRSEVGGFVGAAADDLALMPNATAGINTVLRSMRWKSGDEVLATDHAYAASLNALRTSLVFWSTEVLDVSDLLHDPVDVLFGPEWEIAVRPGMRVAAGSSIIARRRDGGQAHGT